MQGADDAGAQVGLAAVRVNDFGGGAVIVNGHRHGVNRKIAAGQVGSQVAGLDDGQGGRRRVGFAAGRYQVNSQVIPGDGGGAETAVDGKSSADGIGQLLGQGWRIARYGDVQVADGRPQQAVPHRASDQIGRCAGGVGQAAQRVHCGGLAGRQNGAGIDVGRGVGSVQHRKPVAGEIRLAF